MENNSRDFARNSGPHPVETAAAGPTTEWRSTPSQENAQAVRFSKRGRAMSSSRLLVLETLESQTVPVPITALIQRVQLHENTVRGHLTALLKDGFVRREADVTDGRGRPSWLWSATSPEASSPKELEYGWLASALAESISLTSPDPSHDALVAGRSWGRKISTQPHSSDESQDKDAAKFASHFLEEFGFAPRPLNSTTVELHRCPILDVAMDYTDVVCNVHLGLVQGRLESAGIDALESSLIPFSAPGVCTLRLVPLLADAESTPPQTARLAK